MRLSTRHHLRHSTHTTPPAAPLLELHDVSLTHAHHPLLHHLDLTIRPGQHIALVGLTTTAATALTHLLDHTAHPTHGHITTHTPIHTTQPDPTLAQTITGHPRPNPHDHHLTHTLTTTHLDPRHLNTPLTDLDPALTPRIHRARTLYAHRTGAHLLLINHPHTPTPPPEPDTAHLTLTNHPTLARTADRILLLHHGQTTETGTHHQLLLRGGAYARLYARQSTRPPTPTTP
ncbi:ABC transporter ATP-binding protein [Nocardiopsis terrae]